MFKRASAESVRSRMLWIISGRWVEKVTGDWESHVVALCTDDGHGEGGLTGLMGLGWGAMVIGLAGGQEGVALGRGVAEGLGLGWGVTEGVLGTSLTPAS